MAGAAAWPLTASAATAPGPGALLLAVAIGGAIAIAAALVVARSRDRRALEPQRHALAASCAFWWRTDPAGRIVDIQAGHLATGVNANPLRGRLLWEPQDGGPELAEVHAAF